MAVTKHDVEDGTVYRICESIEALVDEADQPGATRDHNWSAFSPSFIGRRDIRTWAERPCACSWLLEGPPGTGKTSVAHCLASELCVDPETDVQMIGCANLNAETVRRLMAGARCRPMFSPWRMVIFEEFEQLRGAHREPRRLRSVDAGDPGRQKGREHQEQWGGLVPDD